MPGPEKPSTIAAGQVWQERKCCAEQGEGDNEVAAQGTKSFSLSSDSGERNTYRGMWGLVSGARRLADPHG